MPEGLMDTGSRIVAAFEAAWCSIQARHAEVRDVVMITGPQRRGRGDEALGYHAPDRWQLAAEARAAAAPDSSPWLPEGYVQTFKEAAQLRCSAGLAWASCNST